MRVIRFPIAPFYFRDYRTEMIDGLPELTTPHRKV